MIEQNDGAPDERRPMGTDEELVEPVSASRSSPTAIVAFILSLFGLFRVSVPSIERRLGTFGAEGLALELLRVAIPVILGVVSLAFAARVVDEITSADGSLGGVAFVRAARIIAVVTIVAALVGLVIDLLSGGTIRNGASLTGG